MKYKSEVIGKNGIAARIVDKSKSAYSGEEIITWEYDAPKRILAQINTHGMLSKNAQSSRAVPVSKVIEQIRRNPVTPVHWGSNQAGMVAGEEIDEAVQFDCDGFPLRLLRDDAWKITAHAVAELMQSWEQAGYHKQIVNSIGEGFAMVRGVITATEFDNFFHLRYHPDADPYIRELARCMWEAYEQAEAEVLYEGEWHVPYVFTTRTEDGRVYYKQQSDGWMFECSAEEALKISSAACGQVSYRKLDLSEETVDRVWKRLMEDDIIHASVTQHQASPIKEYRQNTICGWPEGVSHIDKEGNLWSAQFKHWIMHRKLIPNESFQGKFVVKEDS